MSHRDSCPPPYEARREGERAQERGRGRYNNPYRDDCEEAAHEWERGHRAAERREEERREEQEQHDREERHRAEQRDLEREQEQNYFEDQQRDEEIPF